MRPTTPSASPMIRKASSKRSAGTRFATTGDRSTRPAAEQLDQPRPDGGRVPDAADQLEVAQGEPVRRHAQLAARAGDAERDDSPALAGEPRRQLDGRHRARRLDDEVELALVSGRPARDVDRLARAERARELELRLADPVGDDRRRREQLREDDRQCPERADADDPDRLPRSGTRPQQALEHDRAGLDQDGGVERDVLRQAMDDAARSDHQLAVAAAPREPELVVALAEVRVARAAPAADPAVAEALADDAVAGREIGHALPHLLDDAAPLVPGDARVAHPAPVELALEHLEVGAADAGQPAADEHVSRPAGGCLDLSETQPRGAAR